MKKWSKKAQEGMFSNLILLVVFLGIVSFGGLLAGLIYYDMAIIESTLKTIDFQLPIQENSTTAVYNVTHFQDILNIVVYPILDIKDALPTLTYFMVFAFIIALGMTAYLSSKNPIFFVLHILFLLLMSYFCIILSNMYVDLLSNPFINSMMIQFTIYNKLMIYLPQIVFFTGLLFGAIAFINLIKPQNSLQGASSGIQYGGDY